MPGAEWLANFTLLYFSSGKNLMLRLFFLMLYADIASLLYMIEEEIYTCVLVVSFSHNPMAEKKLRDSYHHNCDHREDAHQHTAPIDVA